MADLFLCSRWLPKRNVHSAVTSTAGGLFVGKLRFRNKSGLDALPPELGLRWSP